MVLPGIPSGVPASAFPLPALAGTRSAAPRIIYEQETITERLILLAQDADGCVHVSESGRLLPFAERALPSPFPNAQLPAALGPTAPVAIIADAKAIRPWVQVLSAADFADLSDRLWVGLGIYTGVLLALLLVALALARWQRTPLAYAYVAYVATSLLFQLQYFGLGSAWLPFWPGPAYAELVNGLSIALAVASVGAMIIIFLEPRGWLRWALIGGWGLLALNDLRSIWMPEAYQVGAIGQVALNLFVLGLLAVRLRRREPGLRWFGLGMVALMVGAGLQSAGVAAGGSGLPSPTAFAFPIGHLLESVCWLIAIATRFRAERVAMERQLRKEATHDPLTGTFNRTYLRRSIHARLATVRATPSPDSWLLFIDVDGFKRINDRFGHSAGDQALRAVTDAIAELDLGRRVLGRFGGDELIVLLEPGADWSDAAGAATAVVERFNRPLLVAGRAISVSVSVGLVPIGPGQRDVDHVIRDADIALYAAKAAGGGRWFRFYPSMREQVRLRASRRELLGRAIDSDQIEVHFQPVIDLSARRPMGIEALVRWRHPRDGLLLPETFLRLADEMELTNAIGALVLERALAQVHALQELGCWRQGDCVDINLAATQLADGAVIDQLDAALARWAVDPSAVCMEIDEQLLSDHGELLQSVLPALRGRDVRIGIEGIGRGQSSLTGLIEAAPSQIKLAPTLIEQCCHLPSAENLVRGVRCLADELGAVVVAVGVEDLAQLERLRVLGCQRAQGLVLAPSMLGPELADWLLKHNGREPSPSARLVPPPTYH